MVARVDADFAVIGGGCAGLSLATAIADSPGTGRAPRIVLIEPRERYVRDRTWCMWPVEVRTIVGGEGVGSGVETHATQISRDRCAVIEATIASSERKGFAVARRLAPLLRGMINRRAGRLWVEDIAYAERRYALRQRARPRLRIVSGE